jgi:adenosylhomocysteine nucleosidase
MAAGCDSNCTPIHTSEIFLTAQVSSIRHRVRGYERVLVATALFATLEITGFAALASGDDAHITVGPIGILGIPEETAQLVASLKDPEERTLGGIRVILGKLANQSVVLCQVGFGKLNAGMAAALLIQKFSPSAIIFTGNAGALNPSYIQGDVVLATDLAEYDFGQLSNGSFAPWQTRSPISRINNPLWFHPAPWLLSAALKSVPSVQLIRADTRPEVRDPKICQGAIVTGDTFVSDASKVQELRTNFNADGVEMEGAAVAQICSQYGIPLLVIRSITDRADGSSYTDYHNFVRIAAQNFSVRNRDTQPIAEPRICQEPQRGKPLVTCFRVSLFRRLSVRAAIRRSPHAVLRSKRTDFGGRPSKDHFDFVR